MVHACLQYSVYWGFDNHSSFRFPLLKLNAGSNRSMHEMCRVSANALNMIKLMWCTLTVGNAWNVSMYNVDFPGSHITGVARLVKMKNFVYKSTDVQYTSTALSIAHLWTSILQFMYNTLVECIACYIEVHVPCHIGIVMPCISRDCGGSQPEWFSRYIIHHLRPACGCTNSLSALQYCCESFCQGLHTIAM